MVMRIVVAGFSMLASWPVLAEIYKCSVNGKTLYSDQPCAGTGGKLKLRVLQPEVHTHANTSPVEVERKQSNEQLRADVNNRIKHRQLSDEIYRYQIEMRMLSTQMEKELNALRNKKADANNNLAGAVWEQSISSEMNAVSEKFRNNLKITETEIDRLRLERNTLKF